MSAPSPAGPTWKRTLGSIAGGVGLLLLLFTAPISYVTVNSLIPFVVAVVVGGACLAAWALTSGGSSAGTWIRSAFFYSSSVGLTVAFIAMLGAVNFIAARRAPSWDLTTGHVFSLSAQTQNVLRELKHPIKVTAFLKDAPPEQVEELFRRYGALTEKFTFEFADPRRSPELARRYGIREGQPAALVVSEGEKPTHTIVNLQRLMNPLIAEQELTNGIMKLETVGTQKLYFIVGHGELSLEPAAQTEEALMSSMAGLKRVLQDEGYAPTELNLLQSGSIPQDASAVIIAGPRNTFSELERALLLGFLQQGGRLLLFAEVGPDVGLAPLLAPYGAQLEPGIVADAKVNPENPYLVYTPFAQEHEITTPLMTAQANVFFPTSRALTRLGTGTLEGLTAAPLVLTTPYAWVETTLAENPTRDDGERAGQLILAMASTVATTNASPRRTDEARLVVFGDSDLLSGAFGVASNRDLVLNSIAWATQQLKKITIRPPDRDLSSVDLTVETLSHIRLVSMVLLPTLLLSIGLTIWNLRRTR